jgi:hypothetical protein
MTFGDVWCHQGTRACAGLAVTTTPDGAVIHRSDQAAPEVTPVPGTRGRTLHIGPGVALTEVGAFVGSLPLDKRPANYTVCPGVTRTPTG